MAELTLEQFNQAIAKLATKDDIKNMATKDDLKSLQQNLEDYTDQVAATILDSMDTNFQSMRRRLDMRDHRMNRLESEVKELKTALSLT